MRLTVGSLFPSHPCQLLRVKCRLCGHVGITAGAQIAADLLHRQSRQPWAKPAQCTIPDFSTSLPLSDTMLSTRKFGLPLIAGLRLVATRQSKATKCKPDPAPALRRRRTVNPTIEAASAAHERSYRWAILAVATFAQASACFLVPSAFCM